MTRTLTVAVIDDHALVREGLVVTCESLSGVSVVHAGDRLDVLLDLSPPPQLVLLDLDLHGRAVTTNEARALIDRGMVVLVVSALGSEETVRAMLRTGISGYVSKRDTTGALRQAIDAVIGGQTWTSPDLAAVLAQDPERPRLSKQETQALILYASGLKLQSVAHQLGVKPTTAKEYIQRVRAKYAAAGRPAPTKVHLHAIAYEDGLLQSP